MLTRLGWVYLFGCVCCVFNAAGLLFIGLLVINSVALGFVLQYLMFDCFTLLLAI